jgi:ArsR family transcriptional regulator, arsenate/arsenite/antimonite-responsive transcriptional repressor
MRWAPQLTSRPPRPVDEQGEHVPGGNAADAELACLTKALAHPARVKIVRTLMAKNGSVCGELVSELLLAQSTVSQHLKVLRDAGLIRGQIDGAHVCYCVEPDALSRLKSLVGGL